MKEYLILYSWKMGSGDKVEMRGRFTQARWDQFKAKPHPHRNDVVITEIYRHPIMESLK